MTDLFGLDDAPPPRKTTLQKGHAWPPGTGPAGETCGSCAHLFRNRMAKTYFKCLLAQSKWTGGKASDVRVRDLACKKWKEPPHDR